MGTYYQGYFKPNNPSKYKGDPTNIFYRSMWEFRFMRYIDQHPEILQWQSEELAIPYRSPVDRKLHRYFVDFVYKTAKETVMVEIKPMAQCSPPVLAEGKRMTARHKKAIVTYAVNEAKWRAARAYCEDRKWRFQIITEKDLGGI